MVGLAALVFTVGAVGIAALVLHTYPRAKASPVPASRVMTLGRGEQAGQRWTLVGWSTANLRCMTFRVKGRAQSTSTCFAAVPVNDQLGLNRFGWFVFGEGDPDIAKVRMRFRDGGSTAVRTHAPWSGVFRAWRYYVAHVPARKSLRTVQGLDGAGHVLATARADNP